MSKPHKCPVCEGRGMVGSDFYASTVSIYQAIPCRSCKETGIVWEPELQYAYEALVQLAPYVKPKEALITEGEKPPKTVVTEEDKED